MVFVAVVQANARQVLCAKKKISSTCLCVVTLKPIVAICKQENMRRECLIHGCTATPWVLSIKTRLNTVDWNEWVVVSRDDEKKGASQKKKPKITLKVAQWVDSKGASYTEALLGRSDRQWKLEEDASSAELGSAADPDSSNSNESLAS